VRDKLFTLRTKPKDEEFHRARRMFVIIGKEIKIGPKGTRDSHLEWFKKEGWLTEETAEGFLEAYARGFYLQSENSLYCYIGLGFWFSEKVINEIIRRLPEIKKALDLNDDTKIYFGPKDNPIDGVEYPQYFVGTLKELLRR